MSPADLKNKITEEVPLLLKSFDPDRSKMLETFADVSSYLQKNNDDSVKNLKAQMVGKFGKCWGQPAGQCSDTSN